MFQEKVLRFLIWISPAFDKIRGPALVQFLWRLITQVRPLTEEEIEDASQALGETTVRYQDVRVAGGRLLEAIFKRNSNRAFTTFYTVNFPKNEVRTILIHELAHVRQYQRVGTKYMWQALLAQIKEGGHDAYLYGGPEGLAKDHSQNKGYGEYNREQQAQIVQDHYHHSLENQKGLTPEQIAAYDHYLSEFKVGHL